MRTRAFALPTVLLLAATLLALPLLTHALSTEVAADFDCSRNTSIADLDALEERGECLARLADNPEDFEICKTNICYIFLQEEPFIIFDPGAFNDTIEAREQLQRPFKCGEPKTLHSSLRGIAFELHALTSSRDSYCIWGGHSTSCTFNALVDFIEIQSWRNYQFAVTGLLLETPARQCRLEPSAPFIDNSMMIIGTNINDNAVSRGPVYQLTQPFRAGAWAIFGSFMLLFVIVCFAIAVRFHVFRGRSLITAFFIFAGERDEAMAHENDLYSRNARLYRERMRYDRIRENTLGDKGKAHSKRVEEAMALQRSKVSSFATKYGLSMTLFRISLIAFAAIFALFYEVAVVNFLFQQQSRELSKSVKSLSVADLGSYSVLKNSALESIWNVSVNPRGTKYDGADKTAIPWQRCSTGAECIRWAANRSHSAQFDVTFEIVGKYLVKEISNCEKLTVFSTRDVLYQFNAGWLYNDQCNTTLKKQVDRQLVALRINGTIREMVDQELGGFECAQAQSPDIGPLIILIPCGLLVLPPLLCSVLVLLCWRKDKTRKRRRFKRIRGKKKQEDNASSSVDSKQLKADARVVDKPSCGSSDSTQIDIEHAPTDAVLKNIPMDVDVENLPMDVDVETRPMDIDIERIPMDVDVQNLPGGPDIENQGVAEDTFNGRKSSTGAWLR